MDASPVFAEKVEKVPSLVVNGMNFLDVPVEVLQHMVFVVGCLSVSDVASLVQTCRRMKYALAYDEFDTDQHRALAGVTHCAMKGWTTAVRLALGRGYGDPSAKRDTALCTAAMKGHADIVTLLLGDPRVNPNARACLPICMAAASGRSNVIAVLLADSRVDPSPDDNDPLRQAIKNDHTDVVSLLSADPRVQTPSPAGWRDYPLESLPSTVPQ